LLDSYHQAFEDELRKAISIIPVPEDFSVLDVGCGDGFFSGLWVERLFAAGEVTGVDVSEDYLLVARQRLEKERRAKFVQGRIERLPFPDGAFDVVWCAQSLYSFPDPGHALREMKRVARPDGMVAVLENDTLHHVLLPWPPEIELRILTAEFKALRERNQKVDKFYVGRGLPALYASAGLRPEGVRTFSWDRTTPFDDPAGRFLAAHVAGLRERVRPHLSPDDLLECERLFDPESSAYILKTSACNATIIDHLIWGTPKEGAARPGRRRFYRSRSGGGRRQQGGRPWAR